jgi:dsDNA-binding SOS-regulon protein
MLAFADDIFAPKTNNSTTELIDDMEKTLESITKWLKKSGLVVNDAKTDLCLFFKKDTQQVTINLGTSRIASKDVINVLGVTFDSKLHWLEHISKTISKANQALNAIKLIRKFFNTKELTSLLAGNFYLILYYNSEI